MRDDLVKRLRAVDHGSIEDCFTQSPLFERAAAAIEAQSAMLRECVEVIKAAADETCDYRAINHLGDGENQHNVKWARRVLAKAEEMLK